jgi:type IV fimbrial biogenesis protein FimT
MRGFTLVELMVTIGVGAIVIGLAVPSFINVVSDGRMTAASNDLLVSFQLARSEAIKRHAPVTVCRSSTANDAEPDCGGGTGWQDGWIVFTDGSDAAPPNASFDEGETIIQVGRGFGGKVTAQAAGNAAPLGNSITFLGSGFPQGDVPGGRNLLLCDDRHEDRFGRVINIAQTGRAAVRQVSQVQNLDIDCQE